MYTVIREYDGFKAVVSEHDLYADAVNAAIAEGKSNSANYYAKVRIYNSDVMLWEESFSPGWTSSYKGD